jgi:exocyst complex component 2
LVQAAQDLDNKLFDNYVKPKARALLAIVRAGILDDSIDWFETPQPKGKAVSSHL